jgi:hypothetical protein
MPFGQIEAFAHKVDCKLAFERQAGAQPRSYG